LDDGTLLEVGKLDTAAAAGPRFTNQWGHVNLSLPFSAAPVVLSQVQTNDDAHWVKTRQRNVTASGFDVAMEENDSQTTPHGSETVGWVAMEAGSGEWSGHEYEAGSTANGVTHDWYTISFGVGAFTQAPRFIGGLATDFCVSSTAQDALDLGYEVVLVLDAMRGIDAAESRKAIESLEQQEATVTDSSAVAADAGA